MRRGRPASFLTAALVASGEYDASSGVRDVSAEERADWWEAQRASIPPMFIVLLAFWPATAITIDALFGVDPDLALVLSLIGMLVALGAVALLCCDRALVACLVLGIGLGVTLGAVHVLSLDAASASLEQLMHTASYRVLHDAREGAYGTSVLVQIDGGAKGRLLLKDADMVLHGDYVQAAVDWDSPSPKNARDDWHDGVVARGSAHSYTVVDAGGLPSALRGFRAQAIEEVEHCAERFHAAWGIDVSNATLMVRAVVLGYTGGLYESSLYQSVKIDGLAHLVAVSGAHFALVCGIVARGIRRLPVSRTVGIVLQVLLIGCYLVLTGAPVSAIRAAVMAALGLFSFFGGRRPYALGGLSLCGIVMIALDPSAAFSTSFLLSVSATVGIIVFMPYFSEFVQMVLHLPEGVIAESLAMTMSASLISGPISAFLFGQVSLLAPIANILVTPLFPLICIGGMVAIIIALLFSSLGTDVLSLCLVVVEGACWLLEALSHMPGASRVFALDAWAMLVFAAAIPLAIWVFWRQPNWKLLAGAMAALLAFAVIGGMHIALRGDTITMLDIGQGDAILFQSEGRSLLIDTGTEDTALLEGLARCGASGLDAVLITHPDDDHCGSLNALRGIVPVGDVLVAADLLAEDNEHCRGLRESASKLVGMERIRGLSVGDVINVGRFAFTVIAPDGYTDGGGNADSVILVMAYDADDDGIADSTGLFCGDAESPQVDACIRKGLVGDIDIYKVGHHGSRAAVDEEMLEALKPEVSIVSVGAYNRYGHPVPQTVNAIEQSGSKVYRTDKEGAITCFMRKEGIYVTTERNDA